MNNKTFEKIVGDAIEYYQMTEENPFKPVKQYLPDFGHDMNLNEEQNKAFEEFMDEFHQESRNEQQFFYLCGVKDGLKMLMMVDSIGPEEESTLSRIINRTR